MKIWEYPQEEREDKAEKHTHTDNRFLDLDKTTRNASLIIISMLNWVIMTAIKIITRSRIIGKYIQTWLNPDYPKSIRNYNPGPTTIPNMANTIQNGLTLIFKSSPITTPESTIKGNSVSGVQGNKIEAKVLHQIAMNWGNHISLSPPKGNHRLSMLILNQFTTAIFLPNLKITLFPNKPTILNNPTFLNLTAHPLKPKTTPFQLINTPFLP